MARILISNSDPATARVTFDPVFEVDVIDEYVRERAPGWWVDWDEPKRETPRGRVWYPMKRSVGRPSRAGAPTSKITFRATDAERKAWLKLAAGRPLGEWIRELCNSAKKGSR